LWAWIAQSVERRARLSGIRSPVEARFSCAVQNGPRAQPACYTLGTESFQRVKRPGRGVDNPSPSSAEVKKSVELKFYSNFWVFMACCGVEFYPLTFTLEFGDFGGLEVACWHLVPKFTGSHLAEAVGFLWRKNPQHAFLQRGSKGVGPMSSLYGM
jgi:hypothetical protein